MNILVTAIGSFSADCVIKSLKRNGHTVIGCDIYPAQWHAVAQDCDKFYRAPFATSGEYIPFLQKICKEQHIDFLMPLTDLEIDVINKSRNAFMEIGVTVCISGTETLSVARNKYALYKKFENDDLVPSIKTVKSCSGAESGIALPAIAKPYNGRSSEGLQRIYDKQHLELVENTEGYIIQEIKEGSVFTVDYIRDAATGKDFSVAREELLRTKNGAGVTVRMTNNRELAALVSHIGKAMNICGCVNMEFILCSGKYYLIDVNPRFSAGIAYSCMTGYDFVSNHLNCFSGRNINNAVAYRECILTKRYYEEEIADML